MRPWSNIVESAQGLHSLLPECLHRALKRIPASGSRARLTMPASCKAPRMHFGLRRQKAGPRQAFM